MKKKILSILGTILIATSVMQTPVFATSTPSSNASSNASQNVSEIPAITGTDLSKEEAVKLFNDSKLKGNEVNNLDYNLAFKMSSEGINMAFKGNGSLYYKNAEFSFKSNMMGTSVETYVVDKKLYFLNPETKEYYYMAMPLTEKLLRVIRPTDSRIFDLLKMKKTQTGYVLTTDGAKTLKEIGNVFPEVEFYNEFIKQNISEAIKDTSNSSEDEKAMQILSEMSENVKYNLYYELDQNLQAKSFIFEYEVNTSSLKNLGASAPDKMTFSLKADITNINGAAKIVLPEEAKNAKFFSHQSYTKSVNYKGVTPTQNVTPKSH